jgi:cob(I)alamin adenosyltransferase
MELYKWYLSITSIISLKEYIDKNKYIVHTSYDLDELKKCIQLVNDTISIDEASKYTINEIETNIFKKGVVVELDELSNKIELCKNLITIIRNKLNDIMNDIKSEKFKSKSNANTDNIKIESTDRDGYYLQMTKTRADVLKAELDKIKTIQIENMIIKTDTFIYKTMPGGSTTKIFIPDVNKKSEELIKYVCQMKLKSKDHYQHFLDELYTTYKDIMDEASYYVSIIDFIKSGARCSDKYYYNKPKIVLNDDKYPTKSHRKTSKHTSTISIRLLIIL